MTPTTCAALAAGAASWLYASKDAAASARLARLRPRQKHRSGSTLVLPSPRRAALLTGFVAAVGCWLLVGPAAVLPSAVAVGELVRRMLVARHDKAAASLRGDIAHWCTAVASELAIGRTPSAALRTAGVSAGKELAALVAPVGAVSDLGGDVGASLRALAGRDGARSLRHVAACWSVASATGAGLAHALQRLATGLQATERLRAEVGAQLAAARASARLLAVLPAFGLLLGQAVGAAPLHFLLHTPAGAVCLAVTVLLDVLGLAWTDRIAARVSLP